MHLDRGELASSCELTESLRNTHVRRSVSEVRAEFVDAFMLDFLTRILRPRCEERFTQAWRSATVSSVGHQQRVPHTLRRECCCSRAPHAEAAVPRAPEATGTALELLPGMGIAEKRRFHRRAIPAISP